MTAYNVCPPEQHEALRRLSAATGSPTPYCGETMLDIPRQAAAMRAEFACRFAAGLGAAFRSAAEELAAPPVSAGSPRY